jgi:ABC-type dipeptide/oligopeptide/nickel transport system permease component
MNKLATFFRESMVARILIPLGISLIVFGIISFVISSKNQHYVQTEAVVSKVVISEEAYTDVDGNYVDATYDVTVKYTVDGKEYEGLLNGMSKCKVGEKMKIYYDPSDPSQITQTISLILPIALIAGGVISLIGGIVSAVTAVKKRKALKTQEEGFKNGN